MYSENIVIIIIIIIKLHAPERAFQHTITIKRLKYAIIYMRLKMVDTVGTMFNYLKCVSLLQI
jgi:hypothetical protein